MTTPLSSSVAYAQPGTVPPLVEAIDLVRDYPVGEGVVHALRVDQPGGRAGRADRVRGRSGSGKTTLLNLLGGLDKPTSGRVVVDGQEISSMDEDELVDVRRRTVAFMFQAFGLVPFLTATENVEVPLRLVHANARERDARVATLLDVVGLADRAKHRPHELSGGEQQRVAHRPGARERPEAPPRRRADRPARLRHRPRDHAAAPRDRPHTRA